jgi:lipopolysaccharide heptosyltransferase II
MQRAVTDPAARWAAARRILAVRLDNLGDVLMATPAIRALKAAEPGRHVTLLASPTGAQAAPFVPEIDAVIVAETPWMPEGGGTGPEELGDLTSALVAGAFDAAVVCTTYSQSALPAAHACWLAGIPLRLAHSRENPYGLLTDWVPDPEPHFVVRHEVRRQLDLVAHVGARTDDERLSFQVRPRDAAQAVEKLRAAGVDLERRYIVVHPGASAPSRRYPEEHYAAVIDALAAPPDAQLVFTGTAAERELIRAIRDRARGPTVSLAGDLSLGELAAVIAAAALLVANNTGPVHIAAALGTPVVDIYALTNPQHAPWQVPSRVLYHDVPCRFCYRSVCPQTHHHCLRLLAPERVVEAAHELLGLRKDRWQSAAGRATARA